MLDYTLQIDYAEVNATMARVMGAMRPEAIHNVASRRAWYQVKTKYADRWKSQVNSESYWQQAKRGANDGMSASDGMPLGSDPGFLTGTTFRAITANAGPGGGVVSLEGMWPEGTGCVTNSESMFKWGDNSGLEYFIHHGYAAAAGAFNADKGAPGSGGFTYIPKQNIATMKYESNAEWMYLDGQDISLILKDIAGVINSKIQNRASMAQAVKDATSYRGDDQAGLSERKGSAKDPALAEYSSVQEIVAKSGMSENALMRLLGVSSPDQIVSAIGITQEAVSNARKASTFFEDGD